MDIPNKQLVNKLGFAGLIPFCLLSLACWIVHPDWLGYFIKAQLSYGVAILSFLGGLHWGIALMSKNLNPADTRKALLWGVIPSMIAWCSMVNVGVGFLVQIIGFVVAYQFDKQLYLRYELPIWFIALRLKLTGVVVAALAFTFIAANVR
ncbi:putative membrane protein [Undibacterium sp. GrIS 1.8]|uniref:DUF3429 domain-containing protein n=1 Tax=unclassified Undibacterium TaxID=2630295 RepID=UPI0033968A1E